MFSLENINYSPIVHFLAHLTTQPSVSVCISIFIFPKVCVIPPRENGIQVIWHIDIKKKKEIPRNVFKRQRFFVQCDWKMEH